MAPRTPQQNGVVERKNRTLQEIARTMLNENGLHKYFWAKTVNTACYIVNSVFVAKNKWKTPYELWNGRVPNIGYFKFFGCKCFILDTKDKLGKFDAKVDIGIFLGYSSSSKAYRVFNKRTLVIEESIHVTFDESNSLDKEKGSTSYDVDSEIPLEKLTIQSDKKELGKEVEIKKVYEESHLEHQEESLQLDISSGQPLPKE